MNTSCRHHTKDHASSPVFRSVTLALIAALVAAASLSPICAEASLVTFTPGNVQIVLKPGESQTIPYSVMLSGTSGLSPYAIFTQEQTGGDIDRSWVTSGGRVYLSRPDAAVGSSLTVSVPDDAAAGNYTGIFSPTNIRSNEPVTADSLFLSVEVESLVTCDRAPEFTEVTALQQTIQAKDNRPITFSINGTIDSPEGCAITKAWYQLTDEYGILDMTKPISVDTGGNFSVAIPVDASRKGTDKDGRVYTVIFGAENEAGTTIGGGKKIIISHDNREANPGKTKSSALR